MDATFRLRRSYRYQAIGGGLGFLAWGVLTVYLVLTAPNVPNRPAAAAFIADFRGRDKNQPFYSCPG